MNIKILKGIEIAENDNKKMCNVATFNDLKKQKEVDDKEETHRTVFRRERDRILYSGGFRRLQDKTQVMAASKTGDHRTRLTHSLEVEQIAISIAEALNLNKDLTSAIALGHDVGHTPFGHSVERFLDKKLKDDGGFSHALESVRYLDEKEMEISEEIIEGILKHDTDVFVYKFQSKGQLKLRKYYHENRAPGTLEAQIVYWADKIAYITHDYEDFVKNNLLKKAIDSKCMKENELQEVLGKLIDIDSVNIYEVKVLIRKLVRNITKNLIDSSKENINEYFNEDILKKYNTDSDEDKQKRQEYIRSKTMMRIEKIYDENKEYKLLKSLDLDEESDEKILIEIEKAYKFYKSEKNQYIIEEVEKTEETKEIEKMIEQIKEFKLDINKRIKLRKEIENMSNIEMVKSVKVIEEYKKLCKIEIDIFEKRVDKIKKKSYQAGLIINLSDKYRESYLDLRKIIDKHYIKSPEIQLSDAKAEKIVSSLYDMYYKNINILPNEIKVKIEEEINKKEYSDGETKQDRLKRIYRRNIASYIASMSDRYAEQIYMNLNFTGSHYDY